MLSYNVLNSWVEKMMKKTLPVKIKTSDITNLSTKDINKLKAGDIVLKKTGNQKHAYIVSYKEENQGICLTYVDATLAETVSYDYNSETKQWTYNSTDSTPLEGAQYTAGDNINITGNVISALVPKLYEYHIDYGFGIQDNFSIVIISTKNIDISPVKTITQFILDVLNYEIPNDTSYQLLISGVYSDNTMSYMSPLVANIRRDSDGFYEGKIIARKKTNATATPSNVTVHELNNIYTNNTSIIITKHGE